MDILAFENILSLISLFLEIGSTVFITFVFFDLVFVDRNIQISELSEKFEKFKRYDVFKASLIYLVLSLYVMFFAKLSLFLEFSRLTFIFFSFISNIFLMLFAISLYTLVHRYVPKLEDS